MSFNEHTGDKLQSKIPTDEYRDNWDKIFGKKLPTVKEHYGYKKQFREAAQKEQDECNPS